MLMSKNRPYKVLMTLMGMEIGGAETHVLELSKTLKLLGVDVHVVSNGGVYVKELEECGIKHYQVPLHNKQMINVFSSYHALKQIIIENNIKLVHAHARIPAFICGVLQKRIKFKLVTTAHLDFSVAFPFNKLSNWGDRTLAVSSDIKDYLLKNYNVKEKNISLTVNAIDTKKFAAGLDVSDIVGELKLKTDSRKIICVSRLDKDRSLPARVLIDIAVDLLKTAPDIEIIIVGDGDDFAYVKEKADAVNNTLNQKLIHLTGQRIDINKFMALADIVVNVSRSALEAMSTGTPVVLAGNQGYLGILNDKSKPAAIETNFTCRNCGDLTADKLKNDLITLLNMPANVLAETGKYGQDLIHNEYSLERMAKDSIAVYEDILKTDTPPVNIVISGYYGNNNSGDDILLQSIVKNLRALHDNLHLTVLSLKPKETRAEFDVDAIYRFNLLSVFLRLWKAKLLISGGGNLIQDETSTRSLIYYLWVINTAKFLGVKNMLYANGIGPVNRSNENVLRVKRSLNKVDLITLREKGSLDVLREIGVNKPITHVTADAAFALPPAQGGEQVLARLGVIDKFFCVALRPWAQNPPNFEKEVAVFVDYLIEKYEYQAVFVPMQPEKDAKIALNVMALMKNKAIFFEPPPKDYNLIRSILGLSSFALCMRLHGLIHAMEKGVPAIGLVYSTKIREFMEYIGQKWHMPVEEINANVLIEYADIIHNDKENISAEIYESGCKLRELAAKNAELCVELID